jgi:hypothetical protein
MANNISWKQQLALNPHLRNIDQWPPIDLQQLPAQKRAVFSLNMEIIRLAVKNKPLKTVAAHTDVSTSKVSKLLTRCLATDGDDAPNLTLGAIPGKHVVKSTSRYNNDDHSSGNRGSFTALLHRVDGLIEHLDNKILKFLKETLDKENLSPEKFHSALINFLFRNNHPRDQYPFTSAGWGRESSRLYFHQRVTDLESQIRRPANSQHRQLNADYDLDIMEEVEFDSHYIDCSSRLILVNAVRQVSLRIPRFWLLTASDRASNAVVGYTYSLFKHPTGQDATALMASIINPWKPRELTHNFMRYPHGGGLPNALFTELKGVVPEILLCDNAWEHSSNRLKDVICSRWFSTLNHGLPKFPVARYLVESSFRRLEDQVHRLPSTSGSHVLDPIKEPRKWNSSEPVVDLPVLLDLIDIEVVSNNVQPKQNLGGRTPLETIEERLGQ